MAATRNAGVVVVGLSEFRRALKASASGAEKALRAHIAEAGRPIPPEAGQLAPTVSGELARGYKVRAAGAVGTIVSAVPYAAGAEWGTRGKWAGFRKYPGSEPGGVGRFAWRATQSKAEEVARVLLAGLDDVVTIQGWATGA